MEKRHALWMSLAIWLALLQYGRTTARLGESKVSYGVLDDAVSPYLIARMPLTGTSVREWVAMTDPAHIKYDHLRHRRRRTYRKSHQRLPPSWLQTMLSQILLTVFHVRVRLTIVYIRVLLAVLRARVFLMLLWARAHWKVARVYHILQQRLLSLIHKVLGTISVGYAASVIEMLLMKSGDVERNPGPTTRLGPNDLVTVLRELHNICADWEDIGLELNLTSGTLDAMKAPYKLPKECLKDMLKHWLNTSTNPSWECLIRALRSPIVNKESLAQRLEQKYCPREESEPLAGTGTSSHDLASHSALLTHFVDTVKEVYKHFIDLPSGDWPPSVGKLSTKVALIEHEKGLPNPNSVSRIQQDYLHGKVDRILGYKKEIDVRDIFAPLESDTKGPTRAVPADDPSLETEASLPKRKKPKTISGGRKPLRILIDGAPGVGKTTLSRQICKRWANGELLHDYDLVLLFPLRDPTVRKASTLKELLVANYGSDAGHYLELAKQTGSYGENIFLIFDGYDELSYKERTRRSLFRSIITSELTNNPLPKCSIVVTSRPYASEELQTSKFINRHVEVAGFTKSQIEHCIRQNVTDSGKAEELIKELEVRQDLISLCYIPLNCAIVLYVYQQEDCELPKTLTELFDIFIRQAVKRHARTLDSDNIGIATRAVKSLDKLPTPLDTHLNQLCALAYKGLDGDKIIFDIEDIEAELNATDGTELEVQLLGLMTAVKSFSSDGEVISYQFLHLSVQEFLAARWVAKQTTPEEQAIFIENKLWNDRFRLSLMFLAGITKLNITGVSELLGRFHVDLTESPIFWHPEYVDQQQFLLLCHMLFESQNVSLCDSLCQIRDKVVSLPSGATLFDWSVVAHFITHSKCDVLVGSLSSSVIEMLDSKYGECQLNFKLSTDGFADRQCTETLANSTFLQNVHTLTYESDCLHGEDNELDYRYYQLHHLVHMKSLKKLHFEGGTNILDQYDYDARTVLPCVQQKFSSGLEASKNLQVLSFDNCGITCTEACYFASALRNNRILRTLNLTYCCIHALGAASLFKALASGCHLERLDLSGNRLENHMCSCKETERSALNRRVSAVMGYIQTRQQADVDLMISTLIEMLRTNKTLKYLNAGGCHLRFDRIKQLVDGQKMNNSLEHLSGLVLCNFYCNHDCIPYGFRVEEMWKRFSQFIEFFENLPQALQSLDITLHTIFFDKATSCLVNTLGKHNSTVEKLKLDFCRMKSDSQTMKGLGEVLSVSTKLSDLSISHMNFSEVEFAPIAEVLQSNCTLTSFTLTGCDITNQQYMQLFKALCSNTSLKLVMVLQFVRTVLSQQAAEQLVIMMQVNHTLLELILDGECQLDSDAQLFKALEGNTSLKKVVLTRYPQPTSEDGLCSDWPEDESVYGEDTALALSKMLSVNQVLEELDLHNWKFTKDEVTTISRGLIHNRTLTKLILTYDYVDDDLTCERKCMYVGYKQYNYLQTEVMNLKRPV